MTKKKSVAESVEALLKPRSLAQSDSEDESTQLRFSESLANVDTRQQRSGILRKKVPQLHELDKKYQGVVTSRSKLDDDDEGSTEDSETDEDDDDEEEDDDEQDMGINDFISQFKSKLNKDAQSDEDGESGEEEEDDDDEDEDDDTEDGEADEEELDEESGGEEEEDASENENSEDAGEDQSSMKLLKPTVEDNSRKGQAVRNQLQFCERVLETRIKVQPILTKANGFPSADTFTHLLEYPDYAAAAKDTQKNVASLLDNLIELQNAMIAQFGETREILKSGLMKRKFVDQHEAGTNNKRMCLEYQDQGKAEQVFVSYRNSVLQKWSERTKVTNARNSKELLSNHNIINQIEGVLLNKSDLIKNSQTVKGTYQLFGQDGKEKAEGDGPVVCPEVYDDTDFYHQMLRELIEYKSNSSTNPADVAKGYSELQKLRTKIKKQVDQKASKGRKIRYVVHKKLVSFMAPYSNTTWTEEATQELFSSLFGNYEDSLKKNGQEEELGVDREGASPMRII